MYEPNNYSYELNPEMLKLLREEFDLDKTTTEFANSVKGKSADQAAEAGKAFFEDFGKRWMKKTHQLGDEYPDRTYEVLLQAIDKTDGWLKFALLPQRFIEIAYLSTQDLASMPIIENNTHRLIYRMTNCNMYQGLKDKCGEETANKLPCQHACLTACKTIHQDLDIDANITMDATIPKDGYCEFAARRA